MAHPVFDSHVHLWPASAAHSTSHKWMELGGPLTRQYSSTDYLASCPSQPIGYVYVETDRTLGVVPKDSQSISSDEWIAYVQQPFEEIKYLRRIVEQNGTLEDNNPGNSHLLKGIVLWAPLQATPEAFSEYLKEAEREAGPIMWNRVKGFRFLLQSYNDRSALRELVFSENWLQNLIVLGRQGYTFDITVDTKRRGAWQLEIIAEMIQTLRSLETCNSAKLIIDHLGKPDIGGQFQTQQQIKEFMIWSQALEVIAEIPETFMKLSGAFSEMNIQEFASIEELCKQLEPWLSVIFDTFDAKKIMFGSDWPVCTVQGFPGSESWKMWHDIVHFILESRNMTDSEKGDIWYRTALQAYGII
ncbi:hypothetical protein IQ07DRAFT_573327 [Pyrenochaeta sp. DS3sAY3a]|nr:hypothetical protein IQ07DRAFT_573327 [Pyrenochaeta sp. DS3sAY3a]